MVFFFYYLFIAFFFFYVPPQVVELLEIVERHLAFKAHGQHALAGVVKQMAHGNAVMDAAHRLGEHGGAADRILILGEFSTAGHSTVSVETRSLMGLSSIFFTPFSWSTTWERKA